VKLFDAAGLVWFDRVLPNFVSPSRMQLHLSIRRPASAKPRLVRHRSDNCSPLVGS